MPVVKVGEPEAVGELQNGDKLRHVSRERAGSLLLRATGAQKLFEARAASQLARERPVASELTFGASFRAV